MKVLGSEPPGSRQTIGKRKSSGEVFGLEIFGCARQESGFTLDRVP